MCLSAFSRHVPRLLAVSLLGQMVLCPASAQTSSESEPRELGAFALGAGTINPGTLETGPHAAAPTPETNEKVETDRGIEPESHSNTGPDAATPTPETNEKVQSDRGVQPESGPSTAQPESKAANSELTRDGSQILINIDKSRQEMTVFVDGIEQHTWPVSTGGRGYATPSGNFTASSMNELWQRTHAEFDLLYEGRTRNPRQLRDEEARPRRFSWLRAACPRKRQDPVCAG
jgi:hypothetical protein